MLRMDTTMVNFTSLAARRALGSTKDSGQKMMAQPAWMVTSVMPNALRAANDVKFTMVVSILSMACWRLGFSYLLCVRMGWGAVGVWVAMVIDWTCRVTCFVLRFRSGAWKTKYQA